jgi:outer membrane protein insertion porin family
VILLALAQALAQEAPPQPLPPPAPTPGAEPLPPPVPAPVAEAPADVAGRISRVEVVGLSRVEEAVILDAVLLRAGEELAPWKVQRDLRALWNTGYLDDVQFRLVPDESGGKLLRILVKEKPAVREVRLVGWKKIKEEDLREALDIEPFTVPSETRISQNARAIRDKYLEKGFYLAEVTPELKPVGEGLVELTYRIVENRKVIVQKVDITGNDHVPDRKIRKWMATKPGGIMPWLTSTGTFIEADLENDAFTVRSVFLEEGFVEVEVDAPKVFLSPDKRYIYVSIHVNEGPQYKIGKVTVTGDFVPEEGLTRGAVRALVDGKNLRDVQDAFERDKKGEKPIDEDWAPSVERRWLDFGGNNLPLKTGEVFRLSTMQGVTQRISDLYGDQGYAFANVVPMPQPDKETRVADIAIEIQRGEKMRVNRIQITGNDPTWDKVVRREIALNEGEIYKGSVIRDARARLERLGFFEKVEITTPKGSAPNELDMNVDVSERPTGSFTVGAGFSSVDSFLLTANVQKSNFLGLGYVMSVGVNVSKPTKQGNVSFEDPFFLDTRWSFRVDGFYNQRSYIEDEYQRGGFFALGRYLDKRNDFRLSTTYTVEDVGLNSLDEYKERLYGGQLYRNGFTSMAGMTFEIDKRNNRINATRGFRTSISTALAGGVRTGEEVVTTVFGGEFNYWESKFNFRFFQPLVPKGEWLVFRYNGSAARIQSTDGSIVPYIHRYRAGGITSIRGYEPFALGSDVRGTGFRDYNIPRTTFIGLDDPDAADDRLVIGGTESLVNNFEIESPIIKQAGISLVTFFDAGNTFGDVYGNGHIDLADLRTAVGFGIRWFSPIGPLRFEWGFPIQPYDDERRAVFDFTIGSAF